MNPRLSIIIPALNEARHIRETLLALQPLRRRGHEVIVVDGGSHDETASLARPLADVVLASPPGRAVQMAAGAEHASHTVLWFLHADTLVPPQADRAIVDALQRSEWGRFDIVLSGHHPMLRVVERLINLRSRLSGIATGDQGIFVTRELFQHIGGMPQQPLMEDVALSRRLKRIGRPACLSQRLLTSSRRWEQHGIVRTILLMWWLRAAYAAGVSPQRLARWYR
ncbi:MAG: TIGR04283 family arsenosugar biosynthesis glycosyltransferase [Gammaproteobacteria bacterium]|nr:TIGR04283 family arsenosugar biosynthesis glycosyltransferase [Gammaproteobacteria bacterium]MCW8973918.1 TIGR04283 family arsenosugar biosynthesis glycosyltransferase [Gammaproteobacteria bacterium]MCW8992782.1 TIGR04283 family arsenosugar biosynthesis glycosyltransferase [Gammaproteobacteria bacterium]